MALNSTVVPVTDFRENCTILVCSETNQAAIVDPGGESLHLIEVLEDIGVQPERILITHCHADHIGAVHALKDHFNIPVDGPHIADKPLLDRYPEQKIRLGFTEGEPFVPDRWLKEGDMVSVGNESLKVFHVPGHTPGHVAYFSESAGLALVGDVLFASSIGRTDLPGGDYETLITSIEEKLLPLGDDVRFIPGHGPESTMGRERRVNPFLRKS